MLCVFGRETNVRLLRVDSFPLDTSVFSTSSSLISSRLAWTAPSHPTHTHTHTRARSLPQTVLSSIHSVLLNVTLRLASGDGSVLSWLVDLCHLVLALRG